MKFDIQKSFPYPVLRPYSDDYTESEFQANSVIDSEGGEIRISVTCLTSSADLLDLIEQGKARYAVIVSCRDTYLRTSSVSEAPEIELFIPANMLRGEVAIDCFIVACRYIGGYQPEDLNPEYEGEQFNIEPGSVLAQEETQLFYFDRELLKPVSSVFDIVIQENVEQGKWKIDFNGDRVKIAVNRETKSIIDYARATKGHRAVLINSIYLAAVMTCIEAMKHSPEEVGSYKWFKVFEGQAHNAGLNIDSMETYWLAQEFLRTPLLLLNNYVFKD